MAQKKSKEWKIHYIKTPNYRTFHSDGFYGGITPTGKIYVEMYIDRNPTPKEVTHLIDPKSGKLGDEVDRISKDGSVREIEGGIIFDMKVAEGLMVWLKEKIEQHRTTTTKLTGDK